MNAVLFDLDWTLIDSLPNVTEASNAVLGTFDLTDLSAATASGFIGLGEQVFIDRLIAATALVPGARVEILARLLTH